MTQEVKLKRTQCNYQAENARFLLECDFSKQYNQYYQTRLVRTRPYLEFHCHNKCDPNIPIYSLSQLAEITTSEYGDQDDELLALSPSPNCSPPDFAANEPNQEVQGNFKFSKRLRRSSESYKQDSPFPKTSTQKEDPTTLRSPIESPGEPPIESPILQVPSNLKNRCIIIGTIFKRMKLQPNVVDELSRGDFHVKCDRYLGHYTSQDDKLVLEDIDETISLLGNIDPKQFVTGIVVALLGFPVDNGSQFFVQDVYYAEPSKYLLYDDDNEIMTQAIERPLGTVQPVYLLVVSSLGFRQDMSKSSDLTKALQNLINFTWGGAEYADDDRCSRIGRILVVGDNLSEDRLEMDEELKRVAQGEDLAVKMKKSRQVKQYAESVQAVKHMDDFFAQLSKTINVDVMPGPLDPSSHMLPQQPFHPCMFPKSCMFSTFNCTTNPFRAVYDNKVEVLATSGQNVDIITKFSDLKDPIEIMKCHLKWGNLAPSAPDNLYSAPYDDEDPFVIDYIPEIYIVGCQESFKTDTYVYSTIDFESSDEQQQAPDNSARMRPTGSPLVTSRSPQVTGLKRPLASQGTPKLGPSACMNSFNERNSNINPEQFPKVGSKNSTLLITVPKFCETFSCVLINLKNLESQLVVLK